MINMTELGYDFCQYRTEIGIALLNQIFNKLDTGMAVMLGRLGFEEILQGSAIIKMV
ncbi:MAG: hypothetical protein ABSB19_07545 [Methylomonas sp.]|jgi:hypothetical protein